MYASFDKMDSPVQIPFKSYIPLNTADPTAIYLQIVFGFIKAIQLGWLPEGTKLPGTRILCRQLNVNRNTLIKAFQDLESQGFIEIAPNKGTFILSNQKQVNRKSERLVPDQHQVTAQMGFVFRRSSILENPIESSSLSLQMNDGWPDQYLAGAGNIAKLYATKLKDQSRKIWHSPNGSNIQLNFKKQLSNYLNLTRGVGISTGNLMNTSNQEAGLFLVMKLLIEHGDKVVVAAPGYYAANMTILDSGAEIISAPVDQDGIDTAFLKKICTEDDIRVLYLNSVYHYPTTVSLSAKRRIEILELSAMYGFVIVEDDYDFDFHFDNNPILPLAAMDNEKRVVYIGSFDRSLPSGFGCGFVTGPSDFIFELEKHKSIIDTKQDVAKVRALTDWIADGEVHRLLKKNKKTYTARRDHLIKLLNERLQDHIEFTVPSRGLAVWVKWIIPVNLMKLRKKCAERGLFLPKTTLYQSKSLTATRLGFGSFNALELAQVVAILEWAVKEVC